MTYEINPIKLEILKIAKQITLSEYDDYCVEDIISKAQAMFDFICDIKVEKSIDETMSIYSDILKKLEKMNTDNR